MSRPTITVNIVSYRYGHLVAHAIDSVLSQSRMPDVIKVWDDGVGDTLSPCAVYGIEPIIQPVRLGAVQHFNKILEATTTDLVMMLGADNWLHREALERTEQPVIEVGCDIVTFDAYTTGETLDQKGIDHYVKFDGGTYVNGMIQRSYDGSYMGSSLYKVYKAKEAGGYGRHQLAQDDIDTAAAEDAVLFARMLKCQARTVHIPMPLIYRRRHRRNFGG